MSVNLPVIKGRTRASYHMDIEDVRHTYQSKDKHFWANALKVGDIIIPDHLLVEGEVNFVGSDGRWVIRYKIRLVDDLFERLEILLNGLVYQIVAVCKIQDFPSHVALDVSPHLRKRGTSPASFYAFKP